MVDSDGDGLKSVLLLEVILHFHAVCVVRFVCALPALVVPRISIVVESANALPLAVDLLVRASDTPSLLGLELVLLALAFPSLVLEGLAGGAHDALSLVFEGLLHA